MLSKNISKQIVVITDGRSNRGKNPVEAARAARQHGITVNAIGVLDAGRLGMQGRTEVEGIAAGGGGTAYFAAAEKICYTLQTITLQATRQQAELMLNQRIMSVTGAGLTDLSPDKRSSLVSLLMKMEEEIEMYLVLVLDTSGSMIRKRTAVEESLTDLIMGLSRRPGQVKLGIIQFPGPGGNGSLLKPLNSDNLLTSRLLRGMNYGGTTPTGPAIEAAIGILRQESAEFCSREVCSRIDGNLPGACL